MSIGLIFSKYRDIGQNELIHITMIDHLNLKETNRKNSPLPNINGSGSVAENPSTIQSPSIIQRVSQHNASMQWRKCCISEHEDRQYSN